MAVWTQKEMDELPDSSFLYIEDGGSKDSQGRTVPRSNRHFPYADRQGNVDLPHLRDALGRIPQSSLSTAVKKHATDEAQRILDRENSGKQASAGAIIDFRASLSIIEAAAGDGEPKIPRFDMVAYNGGPLRLGNFANPVVADLAGMKIPNQKIAARLEHDPLSGVGHTDKIINDGRQLLASGIVSRDTPASRDVVSSALRGFPWQASIGATIERREFLAQGASAQVNGQNIQGPCLIARESTLRELTICDAGADSTTSVTIAAKAAQLQEILEMDPKFSEWLQAKGFDPATVTPDQTTTLEAAWQAETAPPPAAKPAAAPDPTKIEAGTAEDIRAKAAAETLRISAIQRTCKGEFADIQAKAVSEGWDETKTELEVIRAYRPKAPAGHVADNTLDGTVLEAAVRLGTAERNDDVTKAYKPEVLERAHRFRGIGLRGLIEASCMLDGRAIPPSWASEKDVIQAAFSTASLAGILSSAMNKVLIAQYQAVESVAKKVAKKLTANDFKVHTGYRLTGDPTLQQIGPGGELGHGTLAASAYPYSVDTYGRIYGITRQMLKNDDLGALMAIPAMCGRGSALAIEKAFWTLVLANTGSFFGSGNANYISGATTTLTSTGLAQAVQKFRNQTDPQGNPILVTPKFLVVPTSLEETAWELFKSTNIMIARSGSTDTLTTQATANIYQNLFQPCVTPYLNNSSYTGYSAVAWYLFGEGVEDVAAFGIAYLDGNEMPTIQDAPQDPDILGQGWRAYHDFGVCQLDPRGAVMSKGSA